MTKQHFEALAYAITLINNQHSRTEAAIAVASVALQFNPRFDKAKFFAACNVSQ